MDGARFDQIARLLADWRLSRRTALASGAVAAVSTLRAPSRRAQAQGSGTPVPEDTAQELLFLQGYRSGTLEVVDGTASQYTLNLTEGLGSTVYFTDRPERYFGAVSTSRFLDGFTFDEDNPPNAALVMETSDGVEDIVVLELMTPVYDDSTLGVTFAVNVLGEFEQLNGTLQATPVGPDAVPQAFGTANLFIDSCSDHRIDCCTGPYRETGHKCSDKHGQFGPMGFCWRFGDICCNPCSNPSRTYWNLQCNAAFPACGNKCVAHYSGCT